jgi:hypothetical protein
MPTRNSIVTKCRECGAVHDSSFTQSQHHDLHFCDGLICLYCTRCKEFLATGDCPACTRGPHALAIRFAGLVGAHLKVAVGRCAGLSRNARDAVGNLYQRGSMTAEHKQVLCAFGWGAVTAILAPSVLTPYLFVCVTAGLVALLFIKSPAGTTFKP